jgi:hypothetical protein
MHTKIAKPEVERYCMPPVSNLAIEKGIFVRRNVGQLHRRVDLVAQICPGRTCRSIEVTEIIFPAEGAGLRSRIAKDRMI